MVRSVGTYGRSGAWKSNDMVGMVDGMVGEWGKIRSYGVGGGKT
jgi:hypothetical protein